MRKVFDITAAEIGQLSRYDGEYALEALKQHQDRLRCLDSVLNLITDRDSMIRSSDQPCFTELRLTWIGQKINGRTSALAIQRLVVEITVLETEDGGVEISAWWEISKLGRLLRFGKRSAKAIVTQLFDDLVSHATIEYQEVSENE